MNLIDYGWNSYFEEAKNSILQKINIPGKNLIPARITKEERRMYKAFCEYGEVTLKITGKMLFNAESKIELPKTGDWVLALCSPNTDIGTIHTLLPRKTVMTRQAASTGKKTGLDGQLKEQVIAANIDTVFCVTGLDHNFNPQRLERYLTAVKEAGAKPVIILNKSDICTQEKLEKCIEEVKQGPLEIPVYAVSAINNTGIENLEKHLTTGETAVFIGSSGVGKSSIINRLLNSDRIETREVRGKDSHGVHTTTNRELFVLANGGIVIDTPGMREFQVWADENALDNTFEDIETLAINCRFTNCTHKNEPGCAVLNAVKEGNLEPKRLKNYYKLEEEIDSFDKRKRNKERLNEKKAKRNVKRRTLRPVNNTRQENRSPNRKEYNDID